MLANLGCTMHMLEIYLARNWIENIGVFLILNYLDYLSHIENSLLWGFSNT